MKIRPSQLRPKSINTNVQRFFAQKAENAAKKARETPGWRNYRDGVSVYESIFARGKSWSLTAADKIGQSAHGAIGGREATDADAKASYRARKQDLRAEAGLPEKPALDRLTRSARHQAGRAVRNSLNLLVSGAQGVVAGAGIAGSWGVAWVAGTGVQLGAVVGARFLYGALYKSPKDYLVKNYKYAIGEDGQEKGPATGGSDIELSATAEKTNHKGLEKTEGDGQPSSTPNEDEYYEIKLD